MFDFYTFYSQIAYTLYTIITHSNSALYIINYLLWRRLFLIDPHTHIFNGARLRDLLHSKAPYHQTNHHLYRFSNDCITDGAYCWFSFRVLLRFMTKKECNEMVCKHWPVGVFHDCQKRKPWYHNYNYLVISHQTEKLLSFD